MAAIGFCDHAGGALEPALGLLLEDVVARGARAVVLAGSAERVAAIDNGLWTYRPDSFLPHGSAAEGEPARQPVWITAAEENPNGAGVLVMVDDTAPSGLDGFPECFYVFDRSDMAARDAARDRWRAWREAGHALTLWERTPSGWRAPEAGRN